MQRKLCIATGVFVSILLAGCKKAGEEQGAGHQEKPHWEYAGEHGPEQWGKLAGAFQVCKLGKVQSPIDVAGPLERTAALTLQYLAGRVIHFSE